MWGDPGTIKRSPETCFPQPELVKERLRNGLTLDGVGNLSEDGRTFCIRCLVWRPDDVETHHCNTCQRCVTDFDHHCGGAPRDAPRRVPARAPARAPLAPHARPRAPATTPRLRQSSAAASLARASEATWGTSRC